MKEIHGDEVSEIIIILRVVIIVMIVLPKKNEKKNLNGGRGKKRNELMNDDDEMREPHFHSMKPKSHLCVFSSFPFFFNKENVPFSNFPH